MSERLNKVHLVISTIAATVVAIGFIVIHVYDETHGLLLMAMWVSIAIILFYFIGHMARAFLITKVFVMPDEEEEAETLESVFESQKEDEIMVSVDMEMPEDTMMHAPSLDEMNGTGRFGANVPNGLGLNGASGHSMDDAGGYAPDDEGVLEGSQPKHD